MAQDAPQVRELAQAHRPELVILQAAFGFAQRALGALDVDLVGALGAVGFTWSIAAAAPSNDLLTGTVVVRRRPTS